jgi:hypothetical protein
MNFGLCMCGATDCPSCGPAQGYQVVRVWDAKIGKHVYRNPEDGLDDEITDRLRHRDAWERLHDYVLIDGICSKLVSAISDPGLSADDVARLKANAMDEILDWAHEELREVVLAEYAEERDYE